MLQIVHIRIGGKASHLEELITLLLPGQNTAKKNKRFLEILPSVLDEVMGSTHDESNLPSAKQLFEMIEKHAARTLSGKAYEKATALVDSYKTAVQCSIYEAAAPVGSLGLQPKDQHPKFNGTMYTKAVL